ncbi:hypothetical protein C5167_012583 [Papaver somniferum]|uniref:Uncharacterized protein n=1 Tax=Papaver somniferum TaxID=3469 RepID=A0A4Y7IXW3_PAPSO|nr:hypothetical protein C5167_012583 [Papaver somniferum]
MNTPSTSRSGRARRYLPKPNYLANAETTIPVVNAETTIPVMEKCDSLSIHSDSTRRGTLRSARRGKGKQGNGCKNHEGTGMSVENGKESGVIVNVKEKPADQNLASERNEQVADSGTTSGNNLITENLEWRNKKKRTTEILSSDSKSKPELQKEKCRSLEARLKEANDNFEVLDNEQDTLIDLFSEERTRRDAVEENLTNKLKAASVTIQELQDKVCHFERKNLIS